jgi:hypothetical protein
MKYFFEDLSFQGLMTNISRIPMIVTGGTPS